MLRYRKILLYITCCFLCACSGVKLSEWHFPYMMEVQQGNYITQEEFSQLKIGLTKDQVVFILGHPLTQFMFDQNEWDYIYQDYKNNKLVKEYNVVILFDKDNKISNIEKNGVLFDK